MLDWDLILERTRGTGMGMQEWGGGAGPHLPCPTEAPFPSRRTRERGALAAPGVSAEKKSRRRQNRR